MRKIRGRLKGVNRIAGEDVASGNPWGTYTCLIVCCNGPASWRGAGVSQVGTPMVTCFAPRHDPGLTAHVDETSYCADLRILSVYEKHHFAHLECAVAEPAAGWIPDQKVERRGPLVILRSWGCREARSAGT